jgi:hypothetical protein
VESDSSGQASKLALEDAFAETIAPLEKGLGQDLNGVGWDRCFAAFVTDRPAFEYIVNEILNRPDARTIGLLPLRVKEDFGKVRRRLQRAGGQHAPDSAAARNVRDEISSSLEIATTRDGRA